MTANWQMSLDELLKGSGGRALSTVAREFTGIGTDTRRDLGGQIFIALMGESFDAHEFLDEAVKRGASALLVHSLPERNRELLNRVTVVEVKDTLIAMQNLATFWRRKMPALVLGLTGSNGKTTAKEFTAALLGAHFQVQATKGSLNNHWGVPLSLLSISPSDQVAVIEMGMNHLGEIAALSAIAEPDVVVVTMVGRGHLEGLGSIEGVARAKAEIYETAKANARFCFNLDNPWTKAMADRFSQPRANPITFSTTNDNANISFQIVELGETELKIRGHIRSQSDGSRADVHEVTVPVFGAQNLTNLMVAASLALAAGMTPEQIWAALPRCHTVWGRNQWVNLPSGARVLFDGYNANPESMGAAIENFSRLKTQGRKFAVLGEMKEMGQHTAEVHRALGEQAARAGFAGLCFFGPSGADFRAGIEAAGFSKNLFISDTYEQSLASRMLPVLELGDRVLVKGSRGMKLEKILLDWKPLDFHSDH